MVLVVFEDDVTNGGTALFKTVEAFSRGASIFSTSVELKTKGAGGGGAGREIIDSNTWLNDVDRFNLYTYSYDKTRPCMTP